MRRALSLCSLAVALGLAVPAGAALVHWVGGVTPPAEAPSWVGGPEYKGPPPRTGAAMIDWVGGETAPAESASWLGGLEYKGTLPGPAAWALAGAGVALLIPRKLLDGEPVGYRSFEE